MEESSNSALQSAVAASSDHILSVYPCAGKHGSKAAGIAAAQRVKQGPTYQLQQHCTSEHCSRDATAKTLLAIVPFVPVGLYFA